MNVLLGICDERVIDATKTCFRDNKIGGSPNWPEKSVDIPCCDVCGKWMPLIAQVYCPLNNSPYHRNLYVFGCTSKPCWNQSHCWKIIRCQVIDETYQNTIKVKVEGATSDTWNDNADDWDVVDDDNATTASNDKIAGCLDGSCADVGTATTSTTEEQVLFNKLQNVVLEDAMDSGNDENNIEVVHHCVMEDLPLQRHDYCDMLPLGDQICHNIAEETTVASSSNINHLTLCSYYLSVFEEPEDLSFVLKHEQELLKQYMIKEGLDITKITSSSSNTEAAGEKYEKTSLKHGDRVFHKFHKRVSRCPEQLLRYSFRGSPLHIQGNHPVTASPCSYCGAPRVFELQLMPALVNLLRVSPETDPILEFGTVLVYTCENSCWTEGVSWREELALVEADPDEDCFKKELSH